MTYSSARQPHIALDAIIFGLQRFGGISNYWERLTSCAVGTGSGNVDVILPKEVIYRGFDADRIKAANAIREKIPSAVSRYLSAGAPSGSVLHTSYYRLPKGKVERYVVTVYDFIYERYRQGLPRWAHSQQKLASIRRADDVICISDCTRSDVLKFCPEIDPGRVHVVPLGIDHETYFPDPAARIRDDASIVLFVGQRSGYKRFDLAVDAIVQCPDLHLGIVGPPLTKEEHSLLVDRLGSRWRAFGPVPTEQLRTLYSQALAFVFPSDYEGFGLPVLEAMACGCPVVASSAASLREVGGLAASYASRQTPDSYAGTLLALRGSDVRPHMVDAGLARSREFSWERTCAQTFAIYAGSRTPVARGTSPQGTFK